MMCQVLKVNRSGYYAWCQEPESARTLEDKRLLGLIKQSWLESGCIYGYRKITHDLRDWGERCGKNRVHRLMKQEKISSQTGYKKRKFTYGKPCEVAPNHLKQEFDYDQPDQAWVTDITYIRTHEGWLYLAIVLDLCSRKVIGWSMQSRMQSDLVMQALFMAVWRRRPKHNVLIHSDQGSQYTGGDWMRFLEDHHLEPSMSRRGNCYDNAVAESFFQLLKRERIKRRIYRTREEARRDIFDYIELFYNTRRQHGYNDNLSPVEFEKQYFLKL